MSFQTIDTDVLIIGGGAAACRAAIEAASLGVDVTLVDKGIFGHSGCSGIHHGWAIAGAVGPGDSKKLHFMDTLKGGGFLNDQRLVNILANEITLRLRDLENYGNIFKRTATGDAFLLGQAGGHSVPRTMFPGSLWMMAMEVVRNGVQVFEETMITNLLSCDGAVIGAVGIDIRTGNFYVFKAKSSVLAAGAGCQIYGWGSVSAITTNPREMTGDGLAMAYNIGVELKDMELVQFLPMAAIHPMSFKGIFPRGEPAYKDSVFNKDKVRFLKSIPLKDLTRAGMTRAILTEVREGRGTPHGGVWFECSALAVAGQLYTKDVCRKLGIDLQKDYVEMYPTAHHIMGGVVINERCETNVPGLYACGEVTGGVHGSNRLGTNAFSDTQVFGKRAGEYAAKRSLEIEKPNIDWKQVEEIYGTLTELLQREPLNGYRPFQIKHKLQTIMWEKAGILKNEKDMKKALEEIERIKKEDLDKMYISSKAKAYNYELIDALELHNMVDLAEMITRSSLLRKESRESFLREEFPEIDNINWLVNIHLQRVAGEMILEKKPIVTKEITIEEIRGLA